MTLIRRPVWFFILLALATPALAQQVPGKRPLTHNDYDGWRAIQGPLLSRDGKFLTYALTPQEGDGDMILRNLATGAEWRFPRGSRTEAAATPPAAGGRGLRGGFTGAASRSAFTADSRFLIFSYAPTKAEVEQAKKAKKKPEEMPQGGMAILELATQKLTRIERVKNFQVPEDGTGFLAYQLASPRETQAEEKKPEAAPPSRASRRRPAQAPAQTPAQTPKKPDFGSDLVIYNLADGSKRIIPDVADSSFCKDGKLLVYTVASKQVQANGVYAVIPGAAAPPLPLLAGKGKYSRLIWDEKQTQLAFLSDRDDDAAKQPKFKIYHWNRKTGVAAARSWHHRLYLSLIGAQALSGLQLLGLTAPALQGPPSIGAEELVSTTTPGFRSGWVISDKGLLSFSQDGARLFLSVTRPPAPAKDADKEAAPAADKVVVDLWHWKDDYIQPMQKVRAEQERGRSYRAIIHLKDRKFLQLADATMADVTPSQDGRLALGYDDRAYRRLVGYDGNYLDAYLIDTRTGVRKPLLRKHGWGLSWSPTGKYLLYYDGKNWNCLRTTDGKVTNLTKSLSVSFAIEDFDSPSTPPAYGNAGWTKDEKSVLLYDRYDIWQFAPDGKARILTGGVGRKEKIQFRHLHLDPQEKAIDPAKPLLLRAENEETRDSGFWRVRFDNVAPEKLLMAAKSFGIPAKAKDADVVVLTASTFFDPPELHIATTAFEDLKKVTDANPQKAGLLWGRAELIHYKNVNGVPLRGILIKPENFDPARKYPLMVYIYEKLSQNLHRFVDPRPGTSINPTYYVSNGYLVLMPDIVYTVGYPGQSALQCVLPAIQTVVDRGCVNEKAIGIQGHSWGGYQIAYMITQTNRFKAVAAGAPVANMTSAYSGIRWGTGLPRQFQYERTQSRIGGSLWQYPLRFLENSPVFMADRVRTPLLMLHNDQDDAVPWYQGIEYFLALRRLGKEVYLFNYNGEPHGLRKRANQKDYTRRMQQFFDHHLKGAPQPDWMAKGIPYLDRDKEKERTKSTETPKVKAGG